MAPRIKDETGNIFGKLTALKLSDKRSNSGEYFWLCQCSCGNTADIKGSRLRRGLTKSCGCINKERISNLWRGDKHWTTHGHSKGKKSTEYESWTGLKRRCHNPNASHYDRYGGRGITVCERWRHSFENFLADMGPKPGKGYSLDRIDVNGNYEPSNCRWATIKEQMNNRNSWKGELKRLRDLVSLYEKKFGPIEACIDAP